MTARHRHIQHHSLYTFVVFILTTRLSSRVKTAAPDNVAHPEERYEYRVEIGHMNVSLMLDIFVQGSQGDRGYPGPPGPPGESEGSGGILLGNAGNWNGQAYRGPKVNTRTDFS